MPVGVHSPHNQDNIYAWSPDHLVHFSAGAIVQDEQGMILTIYLQRVEAKYFLPTKTHEPGKPLEETLQKISQKVGWELEIVEFLGVTEGQFPVPGELLVTKHVVWFKCKATSQLPRDPEDRDADSEILWKSKQELMQIFESQAGVSSDVDLRGALKLLQDTSEST